MAISRKAKAAQNAYRYQYAHQQIALGYALTRQAIHNNLYSVMWSSVNDPTSWLPTGETQMDDTRNYLDALNKLSEEEK